MSLFVTAPVLAEEVKISSLTLTQAVREALEKSPELKRLRLAAEQAGLEEPLLLAETDPHLQAGYFWSDDQAPRQVPAFQGLRSRREDLQVGIVQTTLIGTELGLNWRNERLRNPAAFRPLDPTVDSRLSLELRQPLLRYFWGRPDKARRGFFRSGARAAHHRLRQKEIDVAASVGLAYLELFRAQADVEIAEESLAAARKLSSIYSDKTRYGLVDESDSLQAGASVEIQETELLLARSRLAQAQNDLRAELQRQTPDINETFVLAEPPVIPAPAASVEEAIQFGVKNRSDIAASHAMLEAAEWDKRITALDSLPDLAIQGSYGVAGLDQTYSDAWDDLAGWDHPVKTAGVTFSVPFAFRKERLQRRSGRLRLEQAKSDHELVVQKGLAEIRNAWETWQTSKARLDAARRLLDLEKRKWKAEQADFGRGRSSTDLVVRFQQDFHRARRQALQAKTEEWLARLNLARATGVAVDLLAKAKE